MLSGNLVRLDFLDTIRHGQFCYRLLSNVISTHEQLLFWYVLVLERVAIAERNLKAIILLAAFAETGLERILDDAFAGRSIEFLLEKIVHYSKWTYEELEEVLQYNREEVLALYPGNGRDLSKRRYSEVVPPSLD